MENFTKERDVWTAAQIGMPCLALLGLMLPTHGHAVEFNESFLRKGEGPVELSYFEKGSSVLPGSYDVDVYLNHTLVKRQDIVFRADADGTVKPTVTLGLLRTAGVNVARLEKDGRIAAGADDTTIVDLPAVADGASVEFESNTLSLNISFPQLYVSRTSRGYVDQSLWDDGISALYSDYQISYSRNDGHGRSNEYYFVGLRNGFNVGGWRVRNDSTLSGTTGGGSRFSSNRSYVERDIRRLRSKVAAGELYTSGDIFDSVRFVGAQIGTDLGMLPDSEVGFAPVVRGIAESNAVVEVRQNGYVIYSTPVPPGAFEITDIYPSGSNGDLEIRITEADGRVRRFSQPYSYLPVMVRRGSLRYAFSAGQFRAQGQSSPKFTQGTLVYGASDNFTGYGGIIAAENYVAAALGIGMNTRIGGLSLDVTTSRSRTSTGTRQGQSVRFLYSKTLHSTNTTFTMVGYRYSTDGYRTLSQHVEDTDHSYGPRIARQKSRLDVNVNQPLGGGSMFAGVGDTTYWNGEGRSRRLQVGYSNSYKNVSYSLSASHIQESGPFARPDTQFNVSVSIPLGKASSTHRLYANAVSSTRGDFNMQTGVSGYLNDSNTVNYGVQAGYSRGGGGSGGVSAGWDTPNAKLTGNFTQDRSGRHFDAGASGSVVVHGGGVTLGQPLGETFAVVQVPKVRDVTFGGAPTVRTDRRGYAIVPYVQPYRQNWLNIDPSSIDTHTEIADNAKMVVPTRGAIVKTRFDVESGRRVQFELSRDAGGKVPFGAQAYDAKGKLLGMVDNQSRLLVFGIEDQGSIDVQWGDNSCKVSYQLPTLNKELAYERRAAMCVGAGTVVGAK
ncbi:fimbria/pilus outer membrane usher protein [Burkholderia ambifaria]|uniref:Fimbrial biogenesis outer membrane usher protein n=1 Tax=Burkholderia ambifaria TaxID=152480 RepID=A0AA41E5V2_9BURK|nr:fimbria/pilus outer membrane usher protein [Burkholderia ambifaria]MBR8128937.1 fimbrial biogenesis outer membrane usher protein [Burkholderia ambifaria]PRE02450.1 usher CupC3 [Burkholderia ambifaria]UEP51586.1 fimbrial biogenesis outer membrane usher protein [Burkholderia ambifaria]